MFITAALLSLSLATFPRSVQAGEGKTALLRASAYSVVGCLNARIRGGDWRGCWRGALKASAASGVEHLGMRMVAEGHHWPGVLMHSLGTSMLENLVDGRALFSRYRMFYLWGSFGYDFERHDFQPQLLFGRSIATAVTLARGYKFDWGQSLRLGVPFFLDTDSLPGNPSGQSLLGTVVIDEQRWNESDPLVRAFNRRFVLRHEMLHTLQYRRARVCNSLVDRFIYRDYNNGPVSFGQDACHLASIPLHDPEVRAFKPNMLRDIVQKLRGRFEKPN